MRIHGLSGTRVYNSWANMMARCYKPSRHDYYRYGGRGIKVCKRWHSILNFFADMGHPPAGKSLDRINNERGYSPSNCRWASLFEQARNTRRNVYVEIDGEKMCVAEWSRRAGLHSGLANTRFRAGWSRTDSITVPSGSRSKSFRYIEFRGETLPTGEWDKRTGARSPGIVSKRIKAGWSLEKAITTPAGPRTNK